MMPWLLQNITRNKKESQGDGVKFAPEPKLKKNGGMPITFQHRFFVGGAFHCWIGWSPIIPQVRAAATTRKEVRQLLEHYWLNKSSGNIKEN